MMSSMGRPSKSPQPAYGRHLAGLRKVAGLSQQRLAQTLGVRQSTVASWEQSPNPPKGEVLPALAAALKVSLDTLLGVQAAPRTARHRGPASQFEQILDKVNQLPRRRQQRIAKTLEALVAQEIAEAVA
jgi:transcriptional regulator with XRE-family HTH domain